MSPKNDPTRRRRKIFLNNRALLFALLICALSVAYSSAARTGRTNAASSSSGMRAQASTGDKGSFRLRYLPIKDQSLAHIEKLIKDSKLFESLIDYSNKHLKLPVDITLYFKECNGKDADGKPEDPTNAWYNPEDNAITMCYGLIKKTEDLFRDDEKSEKDLEEAVLGSTAWTFYHEMGHALIDVYKIAHTGKEEDAADELSTYILINEGGEEGEKAALNGAEDFYREASQDNDLNEEQFADAHSLSKQRFYNIICWVYGSNTEKYASLTKGDNPTLPEGRAEGCKDEYGRVAKAWQNLLASHLKK